MSFEDSSEALQCIEDDVLSYELHTSQLVTHDAMIQIENQTTPFRPHPDGLRAAPAEIRRKIFERYFGSTKLRNGADSNPLLLALKEYDDGLYEEALIVYYDFATVVTCGRWNRRSQDFPASELQWIEKKSKSFSPSQENMGLVKNLRITQWAPAKIRLFDATLGISIDMGKFFDPFINLRELTLDLRFINTHRKCPNRALHPARNLKEKNNSMMLGFQLVYPMITKFPKLQKLSIVLLNAWNFFSAQWDDSKWFLTAQDPIIEAFERSTLEVITEALGVYPKLCNVRTCSFEPEHLFGISRFAPWCYGEDVQQGMRQCVYDVEWFWQAEKGETLIWDMGKADSQAEKFGLVNLREGGELDWLFGS